MLETWEKTLKFRRKLVCVRTKSLLLLSELVLALKFKLAFDCANKSHTRNHCLGAIIPFSVNK
jgi:hypothetical protein